MSNNRNISGYMENQVRGESKPSNGHLKATQVFSDC